MNGMFPDNWFSEQLKYLIPGSFGVTGTFSVVPLRPFPEQSSLVIGISLEISKTSCDVVTSVILMFVILYFCFFGIDTMFLGVMIN
jgi:hypothetical protein